MCKGVCVYMVLMRCKSIFVFLLTHSTITKVERDSYIYIYIESGAYERQRSCTAITNPNLTSLSPERKMDQNDVFDEMTLRQIA